MIHLLAVAVIFYSETARKIYKFTL
jgi:hypothetical protein